jgi:hypothetical protein
VHLRELGTAMTDELETLPGLDPVAADRTALAAAS